MTALSAGQAAFLVTWRRINLTAAENPLPGLGSIRHDATHVFAHRLKMLCLVSKTLLARTEGDLIASTDRLRHHGCVSGLDCRMLITQEHLPHRVVHIIGVLPHGPAGRSHGAGPRRRRLSSPSPIGPGRPIPGQAPSRPRPLPGSPPLKPPVARGSRSERPR